MRQKPGTSKPSADRIVRDIRRKTRKRHSAEEKIRIVLEGLRGDDSIAELCRREGIAQSSRKTTSDEVSHRVALEISGAMGNTAAD
jgi:transposase